MGPTPTITLRVRLEHHDLVRKVAARLKADPAFAAALTAIITEDPAASGDGWTARLEALEARMAALEDRAASVPPSRHPAEQKTAPPAPEVTGAKQGGAPPTFGATVKAAREGRGLSKAALAKMVGLSGEAIRLIENGRGMKPDTRTRLATALALELPA